MIQIDMEMPKCCDECFALDDHGDYPFCLISQDQRGYTFNTKEKRMPTCPLKAQEPRVMTLEEVVDCEEPMFMEDTPFSDWCLFCTSVDGDSWFSVGWRNGSVIKYNDMYYNKTWRCWTSRPDEKRRTETPWMT